MNVTRRQFAAAASSLLAGCRATGPDAPGGTPDDPSVERWRADFPALQQTVDGGRLAYLDSAATTHRPYAVIRALSEYYARTNANPSATMHSLARRSFEAYEQARRDVAAFLNARDPNEVVWTKGTTEGINLVATAWGASNLRPDDEVLVSVAEHYSNLLPWRAAAERTGATLRFVDVDDEGVLDLDDFDRKLSARTRLVAIGHASNVVGHLNPIVEICARAHRAGARVLVDAAQSVPHVPVDVRALDCDFLAFSSHKMLGPMGVGVLWARRELLDAMPPYQLGSNMAHDVDVESAQYEHAALKYGAGTPNVAGPIGLPAAIAYVNTIGRNAILDHERALTVHALNRLRGIRGLALLGPSRAADRVPVFSFVLQGVPPIEVVRRLDVEGIAIRAGDLAALPLLKRFGVAAAARASCYFYSTTGEIDRLGAALERMEHPGRTT